MKFKKFKFKKVKSTNDTAIRIIKKTNYKQGMVISKTQTNGKGQYGRKWISCKGNLFVSFFYEFNNIKISISNITKFLPSYAGLQLNSEVNALEKVTSDIK